MTAPPPRPAPLRPVPLRPARLRFGDVVRVGGHGLRTRPLRVFLSALGIAIGIAAMVSVVGISTSSRAQLDQLLSRIGTNLLTVAPGKTLFGDDSELPDEAIGMVDRVGPVQSVTATGAVPGAAVYRSDRIPAAETNSIAVLAARVDLPGTVGATVASGSWLNDATARYPAVVLGSTAARRLGLFVSTPDTQVWLGRHWFTVVGILAPVPLASELDSAALVGWPVAERRLDFDGHPTTIYERSADEAVDAVQGVLAATANPEHPDEVAVSRPSDAIAARNATNQAFTGLLLGLGAVALLVGGVGVANTMVISVLERRNEIGLRRALGATKGKIRLQFLVEALLLSGIGGAAGVLLGVGVTAGYVATRGWPSVVPPLALVAGVGATLVIGAVAGLYPAVRAARLAPTEALATG
ncbi:MAG TPA: ABC transporter permease [Mycobacteriales bacterium]|nr:ABC transporter permease [Mycobacteriales bacterium]